MIERNSSPWAKAPRQTQLRKYLATWDQRAEALGHVLRRDENGNIDHWVMDAGFCNGPGCEACGATWCHHCVDIDDIQPCPMAAVKREEPKPKREEVFAKMTGEEVLAMRQRLQLNQPELAEKMGVSERTIRRWESEGCPEIVAKFLVNLVEGRE